MASSGFFFSQFSRSVLSKSLWPHGLQHARLPCSSSLSFLKLMSFELVMPSKHLILCHPLLLLPSIFSSIRVFSTELILTSGGQRKKLKSLSRVRLFAISWALACQALPSMGFSRQEYWSGLPFPSSGHLPDPGIKPGSLALQADSLPSEKAQVAKVLELQLQHQSFQWIHRLISFRIDWLDLFAVQETAKSLLQHHSSKASIL